MTLSDGTRHRRAAHSHLPVLVLVLLVSLSSHPLVASVLIPFHRVATLVSLSHSLLIRVAAARDARGESAAADRARRIASLLSSRGAWGLSWDYLCSKSASGSVLSCIAGKSRLLAAAMKASRLRSTSDAAEWMSCHYEDVRTTAAQLLNGLLDIFSEQGVLREVMMDVKLELEEGEFLKDCLELGTKELEVLFVVSKGLFSGASTASSCHDEL
ncbi:unnamed protein product [Urochloa decumbens]|uniref:Uncharacterized protein n=1 Tax=Urochloa decumbens TaxID=240449 RepID=A0ABC9D9K3_9POAL